MAWLGGGVALVLGLAAVLWLRPSSEPAPVHEAPETEPEPVLAPPVKAADLLPPQPLAIARLAIDARARATSWQKDAELAEVRLLIDEGHPRELVFSFAVPRGHFTPGVPLGARRLDVSLDVARNELVERESTSRAPLLGAADPNCPLDAAYRAATQTGRVEGTLRVGYAYSAQHRRELWTFQAEGGGKPLRVDGGNCAILVR